MWFHCFVTNPETGKQGYLGAYATHEEAQQHCYEAVGMYGDESNYHIHPSTHRDPAVAKQEYKHKKFTETGDLWGNLKPISNLGRKEVKH